MEKQHKLNTNNTLLFSFFYSSKQTIKKQLNVSVVSSRSLELRARNFKTAASTTGYSYIADIIVDIFRIPIPLLLLPTLNIDTSNLVAATQTSNNYEAQIGGPSLVYVLALSLFGLLWKSYLGGLGAHLGTEKKCSLGKGIAVFFALGLIGLFITFVAGLA